MNHGETSPRNYENIDKTQKILTLQDQLLNVRKQMSKKQSQWQKQRSNLLSKNEVANIEIIQLKQRISNLSKINQTLTNAMSNNTQPYVQKEKPQLKLKKPKPLLIQQNSKSNNSYLNDSPNYDNNKRQQKFQDQVKRLTKMISEKDFQISNLNVMCSELRSKIQERNSFVSSLEQNNYNLKKKIQKQEQQIIKLHKQNQQIEQKLQKNNQYIDQTRRQSQIIQKKPVQQSPPEFVKKYTSKNSSYLIMKPTPDYSGIEMDNNSYYQQIQNEQIQGYNSDEEEKLLCEICNRVYTFVQFEQHAQYCGYKAKQKDISTKHLFEKKKQIQERLERIRLQQQKQNSVKNWYRKNEKQGYQAETNSKRDKINQIRQIANGLSANVCSNNRENRKNSYNDFSIKGNGYYY